MSDDNPQSRVDEGSLGTPSGVDPHLSFGNFCKPCARQLNSELIGRCSPGTPCDSCGKTDVEVLGYNLYRQES